jgi:hypothetical protein
MKYFQWSHMIPFKFIWTKNGLGLHGDYGPMYAVMLHMPFTFTWRYYWWEIR